MLLQLAVGMSYVNLLQLYTTVLIVLTCNVLLSTNRFHEEIVLVAVYVKIFFFRHSVVKCYE